MRVIKISEEVWQAIAKQGKFGETENDVLERVFEIQGGAAMKAGQPASMTPRLGIHKRQPFANVRMSAEVRGKTLHVSFDHGASNSWPLPDKSDKSGIRLVRDKAVAFAKQNGASFGQEQAVKKALTNAEYWLAK